MSIWLFERIGKPFLDWLATAIALYIKRKVKAWQQSEAIKQTVTDIKGADTDEKRKAALDELADLYRPK